MDFDACIARLTEKDAKDAYAFTQQIVEESRTSDVWYPCFNRFAWLLRHKNSLVRNQAIAILAANARWDREGKFDALLDEFLSHVTDVKPITARQLASETDFVLNLASREYSRAVEGYLPETVRFVTCAFGELKDGKIIEKGPNARWPADRWYAGWRKTKSKARRISRSLTSWAINSAAPHR